MNSFSQGHSLQHNKSNLSSFASQRNNDKAQIEQEVYSPQPLHYHDIIYLMFTDKFIFGLADFAELAPGLIDLSKDKKNFMFGIMEILPLAPHTSNSAIKIGDKFCLRNYESGLYLCAQDELMPKFTNVSTGLIR